MPQSATAKGFWYVCALKLMKTLHDEVSHALIIGLIIQVHSEKGPARSFCLQCERVCCANPFLSRPTALLGAFKLKHTYTRARTSTSRRTVFLTDARSLYVCKRLSGGKIAYTACRNYPISQRNYLCDILYSGCVEPDPKRTFAAPCCFVITLIRIY